MNYLKNNVGVFAILFGLALIFTQSAFKAVNSYKSSGLEPITLYYHGPTYSLTDVTTESYWNGTPNEEECADVDQQACSITIDRSFVDNPDTAPQLNSSANLIGTFASGTAYIVSSDDTNMVTNNTVRP
ncbi:hypothetical protein [Pedobacter sp. MW01-1-1]|uniref:hypothetical protein n=1 Tax=Pedobacter sp. MW01-1-1 TaxID=3383027 RepID=UPI003FEEBF73